ncbi:MAG TPA: hypothetical protein VFP11_00510, partial [Candidatus Angelobacter sp.]|nr:hypothetical protein [Candidatus Angelobacter sp.]
QIDSFSEAIRVLEEKNVKVSKSPRLGSRAAVPEEHSLDADMHFFVDIATSVPQYLVCKHSTIQFVGLQKSEIGLQGN